VALLDGAEALTVCNGTPGAVGTDGERGPMGAPGAQGVQGLTGIQGPPSTDGIGAITDAVYCSSLQLDPFFSQNAEAWLFSSGWVFARFTFSELTGNSEAAGVDQSNFHPPGADVAVTYLPSANGPFASGGPLSQQLEITERRWVTTQNAVERINIDWGTSPCAKPFGVN